jgi:hypothetical protein
MVNTLKRQPKEWEKVFANVARIKRKLKIPNSQRIIDPV